MRFDVLTPASRYLIVYNMTSHCRWAITPMPDCNGHQRILTCGCPKVKLAEKIGVSDNTGNNLGDTISWSFMNGF
jgi:hypothetical protein